MEVEVAQDNVANPDDLFRLAITYWSVDPRTNQPVTSAQESFLNLSMSPSSPRYVLDALATSQLVSRVGAGHRRRAARLVGQRRRGHDARHRRAVGAQPEGRRSTSAPPSTSRSSRR